ncbi:MAG: hypothetical protein KDC98_07650 [Planctomycetes bacterium]|nr:hypothetical protein [Planctomycetota bacterium]
MSAFRLVLASAAGLGAAAWLTSFGNDLAASSRSDSGAQLARIESGSFDEWLPALNRGVEVTFSGRQTGAAEDLDVIPGTLISKIKTLGPLEGEDLERCIARMEAVSNSRFEALHARPAAASDSAFEMLEQAELLCAGEEYLAAADALRQGYYFTTAMGQLPPPPPGAGILRTEALKNGERVVISVILPHDEYVRFADAFQYKSELWMFYPGQAVSYWNEQDAAWRKTATERVLRLQKGPSSAEDKQWRRRYAPGGTVLDAETGLLSLN